MKAKTKQSNIKNAKVQRQQKYDSDKPNIVKKQKNIQAVAITQTPMLDFFITISKMLCIIPVRKSMVNINANRTSKKNNS